MLNTSLEQPQVTAVNKTFQIQMVTSAKPSRKGGKANDSIHSDSRFNMTQNTKLVETVLSPNLRAAKGSKIHRDLGMELIQETNNSPFLNLPLTTTQSSSTGPQTSFAGGISMASSEMGRVVGT
mmetsp:Transcript_9791/g.16488  ORF Transcript_9791/g.16488 Transcript_9791/m.16488 type:complete len:124 (-) Transcript_9791:544-915(-)